MAELTQLSPPQTSSRQAPWLSNSLWSLMTFLCLVIAVYAATYFFGLPGDQHFARYIRPLRLHIAGGIGALLAGPWQFSQKLRSRNINLHRWLGRFYLVEIVLGAIGGLAMSLVSEEGLATHLGFGMLAVLWFVTGLQAYRSVKKGQIELHRQWMIRNFALTLAAVTLRIELPFMLAALRWPFSRAYIIVAWLCWVPNAMVAEWMISRRKLSA